MSAKDDLESVCSVAEMARVVRLSRARFYHLIKAGVFPAPLNSHTGRPMYPSSLQLICRRIRDTGIGFDGQPVRFNTPRKCQRAKQHRHKLGSLRSVVEILEALGVDVAERDVARAVEHRYPKGIPQEAIDATVVRSVMRYLRGDRQKSV